MFEPVADLPYLFATRTGTAGGPWNLSGGRSRSTAASSALRAAARAALMYLHGTDGLAEWPTILDTLAERFDVIVPDHPGFGASEAPAWIDDVSDVAYCYL